MPRAVNLLRPDPHYRSAAFSEGLARLGYDVITSPAVPLRGDVLLIWNRYGYRSALAREYELAGCPVLVAENCPFGNSWRPGAWYSLALSNPAVVGGVIAAGSADRWSGWNVAEHPWRAPDGDVVVFAQRSIGNQQTASPPAWAERTLSRLPSGARVREHPGVRGGALPLVDDLRATRACVTWASSAALQALLLGVPVWADCPLFVGGPACRTLEEDVTLLNPNCDDAARREVFRRLAWGVWELEEIRSGAAAAHILSGFFN